MRRQTHPGAGITLAASALLLLTGCATLEQTLNDAGLGSGTSTGTYPTVSNTVKQGCMGGVVAGVIYSAANSKRRARSDKDRWKELGKDVLKGLGAGCTVAVALDNRRRNSASTADYIEKETTVTRNLNRELANVNAHLKDRTSANRARHAALVEQKRSAALGAEAVRSARNSARADLAWARSQLETAESNLEAQRTVARNGRAAGVNTAQSGRLSDEVAALERQVSTLEREIVDLSSINDAIGQFSG